MAKDNKRGRGTGKYMMAKREKESRPLPIQFDRGTAIIENASEFSSFCGVLGRTRIQPDYLSWRHVPSTLKDLVWSEIKILFELTEDHKKLTLKKVGLLWRRWKVELVHDMRTKKECEIRAKWPEITDEAWERFKKYHDSDEFKTVSAKNKELRKKNAYDHKLGQGGYKRLRRVIENKQIPISCLPSTSSRSTASTSSTASTATSKLTCANTWLLARTDLNSGKIPKENVQQVAEKKLNEEALSGEWRHSPFGEKGGRYISQAEIRDMEHRITQRVLQTIVELLRGYGIQIPEGFGISSQLTPQNSPISSSSSTLKSFPVFHETRNCFLAIEVGNVSPEQLVVAKGKAYPWSATEKVHGVPLLDNHLKIRVEVVQDGMGECELPTPTTELHIVQHVEGISCQWPKHLIILDLHEERFHEIERLFAPQGVPSFGSARPERNFEISPQQYKRLGRRCLELLSFLQEEPRFGFMVPIKYDLFHYPCVDVKDNFNKIAIDLKDFMDLLRLKWIGVAIIQIFERSLYDMLHGGFVGFVCPARAIIWDPMQRQPYMHLVISKNLNKSWIMMPVHNASHWFLLLIHRITKEGGGTVYYIDSLSKSLDDTPYKSTMNAIFKSLIMSNAIKNMPTWVPIDCPQQPNGNDCGFYTMLNMRTIVAKCVMAGNPVEEVFTSRSPYSDKDLDDICNTWAGYFLDKCIT